MITIFDIIKIAFPIFGIILGFKLGNNIGFGVGIVLASVGLLIGYFLGKLPFILVISSVKNGLEKKSSTELRQELTKNDCLIPNVILLELLSRNEDISNELGILLKMLESDESDKRIRAWNALESAFPDMVKLIPDHHYCNSLGMCKQTADKLRTLQEEEKKK